MRFHRQSDYHRWYPGGYLVGTVTLGFGGTEPFVMLAAFFLSSNVIGPILGRSQFTQRFMSERRTGAQVWANGFWFIIAVLSWFVTKGDMFLIAAFAALATANADTWATEAGTRINFGKTRSILGFKAVPRGTDGGVSCAGDAGSGCRRSFLSGP